MASVSPDVARLDLVSTRATRPWTRTVALASYALLLAAWCAEVEVPRRTGEVFGWLWLATVAWHVEAPLRHHLGFLRDWSLPLAALTVYFYSRAFTDDLGIAPHFSMPVRVDTWLGAGTTPTERLQATWCGSPCPGSTPPRWYDGVLTTIYLSHFVTGLGVATVLWLRNRVEWIRWMRRYLATSFLALAAYLLYPMAPPWLAARDGYLPGDVERVTGRGWGAVGLGDLDQTLQGVGNPVAAMPSLHAGMAFLVALYAVQRLRPRWRWVLLAYPVAMAVALVYFGEHYVVDVLAGALLAAIVLLGSHLWEAGLGG